MGRFDLFLFNLLAMIVIVGVLAVTSLVGYVDMQTQVSQSVSSYENYYFEGVSHRLAVGTHPERLRELEDVLFFAFCPPGEVCFDEDRNVAAWENIWGESQPRPLGGRLLTLDQSNKKSFSRWERFFMDAN